MDVPPWHPDADPADQVRAAVNSLEGSRADRIADRQMLAVMSQGPRLAFTPDESTVTDVRRLLSQIAARPAAINSWPPEAHGTGRYGGFFIRDPFVSRAATERYEPLFIHPTEHTDEIWIVSGGWVRRHQAGADVREFWADNDRRLERFVAWTFVTAGHLPPAMIDAMVLAGTLSRPHKDRRWSSIRRVSVSRRSLREQRGGFR